MIKELNGYIRLCVFAEFHTYIKLTQILLKLHNSFLFYIHFLLFSAFFCAVSLIVFHTKALNDLRWIENKEKHNQGWSFFILIPAIFCFIISGVTTVMAARRFRRDDSGGPVAIPYTS